MVVLKTTLARSKLDELRFKLAVKLPDLINTLFPVALIFMALLPKVTLQPPPLIKLSLESLKSKI